MKRTSRRLSLSLSLALVLVLSLTMTASANHSWGNYHWAQTANPFTLALGDNVSGGWDSYLSTASADWSQSTVLDTVIVAGGTRPRNCRPTSGRVEVCNERYGNTGWLGIAQIWASGDHITEAVVKLNDTYFNTPTYDSPAWRNLVMCQEIGHTLGLDHQDVDFNNEPLGTCMDYSSDPVPNQHPNQHDYDQLESIYAHLDSTTTVGSVSSGSTVGTGRGKASVDFNTPAEWGKLVRTSPDGRVQVYERDLGNGNRMITHVFWAE